MWTTQVFILLQIFIEYSADCGGWKITWSLGEVAGSQGNWITGAYTSDKNLLVGARNDLRNETFELDGTYKVSPEIYRDE